jgi:hypothetical protein
MWSRHSISAPGKHSRGDDGCAVHVGTDAAMAVLRCAGDGDGLPWDTMERSCSKGPTFKRSAAWSGLLLALVDLTLELSDHRSCPALVCMG